MSRECKPKAPSLLGQRQLGIVFLTVALDLIGFGMVVPLLPLYAKHFSASPIRIAFLLAIYSAMQFVFAPIWGALSDRVGRRKVLLFSIAMGAVANFIFAVAPCYFVLLIARFIAGAATANIAVASAYVADITTSETRARGMGLLGAAFGIGFIMGPAFGGELAHYGQGTPALGAGLLGTINFVWALLQLPESLPAERRKKGSGVWWRDRLGALGSAHAIQPLLWAGFLQVLGFAMLEMALSLFASQALGLTARGCGRLFAWVGLVLTAVQGGLIGPLSRRFDEIRLGGAALLTLGFSMLALPVVGAKSVAGLAAVLAVIAVGQGVLSPSLSAAISKRTDAQGQGAALGLLQSLSALGRTLGPQAAGILLTQTNLAAPFMVGGGCCLVACIFVLRLLPLPQDLTRFDKALPDG